MTTQQSNSTSVNSGSDADRTSLIELTNISKKFGRHVVLDGVDLKIGKAEAVGIIGDNGAGKSTLVKILSGVYRPSSGTMRFEGEEVNFNSPLDARRGGIEMIYQDLALCEDMDVASNIFMGREMMKQYGPFKFLDRVGMAKAAAEVVKNLGLNINVDREVGMLSGGERQMIAIARALLFSPRALLMDEPTAALSTEKIRRLLDTISELKNRGVSILLVSHRFTDILHICDRIIVVRQGQIVGEMLPHEHSPAQAMALMTEYMTGNKIEN
tara:strand:- start:1083 stop:1892 length:810 start_codon:yes stop_codon:yes gene_type:complete